MVNARSIDEEKLAASGCTRCTSVSKVGFIPLVKGRIQVVYGVGPPNADLMFIGEAPGRREDEQGEPFVGNAGSMLNERLEEIGVLRKDVYITNVVKCRPTKEGKGRRPSNRHPCPPEIVACAPWLDEQVRLSDPRLIVPLGVYATCRVFGREVLMGNVHGKIEIMPNVLGKRSVWNGRTVIPTYHPAGIRGNEERMQAFCSDFEIVRDVYGRLRA